MDFRKHTLTFDLEGGKQAIYEYKGDCMKCGARCFQCKSSPIRADEKMENKVAAFVATSRNEPAAVYCQEHYLTENPHVVESMKKGLQADLEKDDIEQLLAAATLALGGTGR